MNHLIKAPFVFISIILFGLPSLAFGDEVMHVSVIKSEPLGFINAQGKITGTHWNYVQAIAKRSGINIKARLEPKARLFKNLKLGKIDAAIVFRSKKRDAIVKYAGKIRSIKFVALNHKGTKLDYYSDLKKRKNIGVMKSTKVSQQFDNDEQLSKYFVKDYDIMIKMFMRERIETLTGNAIVLSYLINKYKIGDSIELPGLELTQKEQWFHISKKSQHLNKLTKIKQAILSLQKDGTFDQILTESVGSKWKSINK